MTIQKITLSIKSKEVFHNLKKTTLKKAILITISLI